MAEAAPFRRLGRVRLLVKTAGVLVVAWSATAGAATVSEQDAINRGAEHGPGVAIAKAPMPAYDDALDASHAWFVHSPRVVASGGQRFTNGTAGFEAGVSLIQDIPLASVGGHREDAAHALISGTRAEVSRAKLEAAARAAMAWATAREGEEVLALRTASKGDADELLRLARARVTAGTGMPSDVAIAQGEVALAEASVLDAEGMLTEAMNAFRFALGEETTAEIDPDGPLASAKDPPMDEATALKLALERSPALGVAGSRRDLAKSDAALAHAILAPTIGVGASYLREGTGDNIWTAIVAFPLPFARPGAYESARIMGTAYAADRELDLVRAELTREIALASHECRHTREARDAFERATVPLKEAVRLAKAQLEAGTSDAQSFVFARQRLLATQERATRAAADVLRADVRLEQLTGTLLGATP